MLMHIARRLLQPAKRGSFCILSASQFQAQTLCLQSVAVRTSSSWAWKNRHHCGSWQSILREQSTGCSSFRSYRSRPKDTLLKIIVNSPTVENVFQLITQNPAKVYPHHVAIAISYAIELCKRKGQPADFTDWAAFEPMCTHLALHCSELNNRNLVQTLQSMMTLRLPHDHVLFVAVASECERRLESFSLIDLSKLLEYLNIMQATETPLRKACAKQIAGQLDVVTSHRTLVPLLSYYRDEYTPHVETSVSEETDQDTRFYVVGQHLTDVITVFLGLNRSPMRMDILKIGDLAAFAVRWQKCNPELVELLLDNRAFFYFRHDRFLQSLAVDLPQHFDSIPQNVFILLAKYISHHAVRSVSLLEALSKYLVQYGNYLGLDDVQRLMLPVGKLNYLPENYEQLFSKMEEILLKEYKESPLATVNVMMSLVQMKCFPVSVLEKMFTHEFVDSIFDGPNQFEDIKVKLSMIDQAVELECPAYNGPRLPQDIKVSAFYNTDQAYHQRNNPYLNHVKTAIQEMTGGERYYLYQPVLAPGCAADFELHIDSNGNFLQVDDHVSGLDEAQREQSENVTPKSVMSQGERANHTSANSVMSSGHAANQREAAIPQFENDRQWTSHSLLHQVTEDEQNLADEKLDRDVKSDSDIRNEVFSKNPVYDSRDSDDDSDARALIGNEAFYSTYGRSNLTMELPGLQMSPLAHHGSAEVDSSEKTHDSSKDVPEELTSTGSDVGLEFMSKSTSQRDDILLQSPQNSKFRRVVLLVQDKMFFCSNSEILLSRQDMQNRHLHKMGYGVIQVNHFELDKLETMAELKTYLHNKIFPSTQE